MKNTTDNDSKNQSENKKEIILSDVKNIHELPLFLASNPKDSCVQIQFDPIQDSEGKIQRRVVNISALSVRDSNGNEVQLYLNTITLEFWFWLCWLWQQMPEPDRSKGIVRWTRYELLKLMGREVGGTQYKVHDDHITRLAGVSCEISDCFFSKGTNETLKKVRRFVLLSALDLTERRDDEVVMLDQCQAVINPLLVENFLCHYTKPINVSVFSSINSQAGIARKLYTRLDSQFAYHDRFEMTTERFFRESGIFGTKYKNPSARKQNLDQAIKHLLGKRFTSNKIIKRYTFQKTSNGKDWKALIWAHQIEVLSGCTEQLQLEESDHQKKQKTQAQDVQLHVVPPPTLPAQKEPGLVPIQQTLDVTPVPEPVTHSQEKDATASFCEAFISLFPKADTSKVQRSRGIKSKVGAFVDSHGEEKAQDFLHYCADMAKKNEFSMLLNAETPQYLFKFKCGDERLVDCWQKDRAAEAYRKEEEKKQVERTKEFNKDIFTKEKRPEYEQYITECVAGLSKAERALFDSYFTEKEEAHLNAQKPFYKKMYKESSMLQSQLRREVVIAFSQEYLDYHVQTFEEWVEATYPEPYHALYCGNE